MIDIIYRGPFQSRRLAFLVELAIAVHGEVRFTWLHPDHRPGEPAQVLRDFMVADPGVVDRRELDGRPAASASAMRRIRSDARSPRVRGVWAVGFTALPYARAHGARPLVWCMNGIPEERLLHNDSRRKRLEVQLLWGMARMGRKPEAIITVSSGMSDYVDRKISHVPRFVAPTNTVLANFQPPAGADRRYLAYQGSGAPWQNLDQLGRIWSAIHRLDPRQRFLVISKDPRTRCLADHLPRDVVRIETAETADRLAELLWQTKLGFIVRQPHIVNTCAFPTKFGEFVAAGVPVVVTDIGWDLTAIVRRTGCGLVIEADDEPERHAQQVLAFLDGADESGRTARACADAAAYMERSRWLEQLEGDLQDELT